MDRWADRYVPYITDNTRIRYDVGKKAGNAFRHTPNGYERKLRHALNCDPDRPILNFGPSPRMLTPKASPLRSYTHGDLLPVKCLDLPDVTDDFYLNVLDWSKKDVLAIGMHADVWTYDMVTLQPAQLYTWGGGEPWVARCLKWNRGGMLLAVGFGLSSTAETPHNQPAQRNILLDMNVKGVRAKLTVPNDPSSLSWRTTSELSCGTVGGDIIHQDLRMKTPAQTINPAHAGRVIASEWREDGQVLATGGNDNYLQLYDIRKFQTPLATVEGHGSAIKAIAWNPVLKNVIASGGGQQDQRVRLWELKAGGLERINSIWTAAKRKGKQATSDPWEGQVTGLLWAQDGKVIMVAHGNKLTINHWKPELKTEIVSAHDGRILCLSGCGRGVATFCAEDESLKFWEPKHWNAPPPAIASLALRTGGLTIR